MKNKLFILILLCVCFSFLSTQLFSQKIKIKPHVGLIGAYNNVIVQPDDNRNSFRTNILDFEASYGAAIEYWPSERNAVSIGITTCQTGYSYQMTFFKGECNPFVKATHFSAESPPEFTLGYHLAFNKFGLIKKKSKKPKTNSTRHTTFPLKARLILTGGLGLSILSKNNEELNMIQDPFSYTCPDLNHKADIFPDSIVLKKKTNYHVWGRIGLQFFHKDKERIELAITFNQGVSNHYTTHVKYRILEPQQTTNYAGVLGSKGTSIALTLSYPITIWQRK